MRQTAGSLLLVLGLWGCTGPTDVDREAQPEMQRRLAKYTLVPHVADLGGLTDNQRRMLPLLIDASRVMDELFWLQAYGDRASLLDSIDDPAAKHFAEINYGPWDRLAGNEPFLPGFEAKPPGANLYPVDVTIEELQAAAVDDPALVELYTIVRRNRDGSLAAEPYSAAFADQLEIVAGKLRAAAALAEDPGFKRYLDARATALLTDDYRESDRAWLDMKDNAIDFVVGPIETYEDQLAGYKAAFSAYLLLKDRDWSARLQRYAAMLPDLQAGLPVPARYKTEQPGTDSDLNAYDVLYQAGDSNAGSKTIAINLPNDEVVTLEKGSRRLQLKNNMRAKFDRILEPIAERLIAPDQRGLVTFDAFFGNTMFHEVAHGLGINNTITGRGTVREALREHHSALEEGKADVLGLYMVTALNDQGELEDTTLEQHYVTFAASTFRSIRFGTASAHGRANMIRFNFFVEAGAFERDPAAGTYRVNLPQMRDATQALSEQILRFQGDGDYAALDAWMTRMTVVGSQLQADLDSLAGAGIPVDIEFEQGEEMLGLTGAGPS